MPTSMSRLADAIEHYQTTTATWTLRDFSQAPALLGTHWMPRPPGITAIGRQQGGIR